MLVLHTIWSNRAVHLWAESASLFLDRTPTKAAHAADEGSAGTATLVPPRTVVDGDTHTLAIPAASLREALAKHGCLDPGTLARCEASSIALRLPWDDDGPRPSDWLAASIGDVEFSRDVELKRTTIDTIEVPPDVAARVLLELEDADPTDGLHFDHDTRYWMSIARFALELLVQQRFVPSLIVGAERTRAVWYPWLDDQKLLEQLAVMLAAMPPVVRSVLDDANTDERGWTILHDALTCIVDATARAALIDDDFAAATAGRDASEDQHVAWLAGLLDQSDSVSLEHDKRMDLRRGVGSWIGALSEAATDRAMRLALRLEEPLIIDETSSMDSEQWTLSLHLRPADAPDELIDVQQLWSGEPTHPLLAGMKTDELQELVLAELARAARVWNRLEDALSETVPQSLVLNTSEAYQMLSEVRPVLAESGVDVIVPGWWGRRSSRLGARLHIAPARDTNDGGATLGSTTRTALGLESIVEFQWQIAIGDDTLSRDDFERLAKHRAPLVRMHGQWIEVRREDYEAAVRLMHENPSGEATLRDAFRLAHGGRDDAPDLPVFGMDASGWVRDVLDASADLAKMPAITEPDGFHGELRPYQVNGLQWLSFLDQFGFGACLADDMGLGKTIQLIALLLHERETTSDETLIGPTLIVVPTSLIVNWSRELDRFAPSLSVLIHHGPDRPSGDDFEPLARQHDVIITTYGLVSRDRETLTDMPWHRVVLDEAQYIKNPPTKQTAAIRAMQTSRRIALTGTPLENRLTELWSIMEFGNPGHLGSSGDFRRRFAVPIERHRDDVQAERLRELVQPFVLRRLKTDPTVIQDLPDLVETREYATLTPEQASLYQQVVSDMMHRVDQSEGIQRRGLVLASLVKLKQICNHPAHYLKERDTGAASSDGVVRPERSGKASRIMTMLEEIVATGDKALVFTQFREMGHLLVAMVQQHLDREALFMHGGTPVKRRHQLVERFQTERAGAPVFVLSLKAGGIGLNLTAANHVFHFDRWWNPAVEKQATDRAFRIGQTRNVQVHKFVCTGTLEERIDQMLEQKSELAENIIGSGENWLTELSTQQLKEMLTLRGSALESDG